ncbi:hypothetical protein [Mycetohabitans endofungorum]|uniref:hypothetical protein n=1 Tax=Mycetohabitans endofungorum TaxID=417203 RepID=UPI0030D44D8E
MEFDLNTALNDSPAYVCTLASVPSPTASSPPPQPPRAAWANPRFKQPTTYQDLPTEVIARIGDYVPVQDVIPFSTVNRRTYHAMQTRRLVHSYWQRAQQAASRESVNQLLNEMDGTLANPAQHAAPLDALRQRLRALPEGDRADVFKRVFAAAQRIPQEGVQIHGLNSLTLPTRWSSSVSQDKTMCGRNWRSGYQISRSILLTRPTLLSGITRCWHGCRR